MFTFFTLAANASVLRKFNFTYSFDALHDRTGVRWYRVMMYAASSLAALLKITIAQLPPINAVLNLLMMPRRDRAGRYSYLYPMPRVPTPNRLNPPRFLLEQFGNSPNGA